MSGWREKAAGSSSASLFVPRNSRKKFRNLSRPYLLLPDPVWIFSQSYFTRSPLPYARPGHGLMKLAEKNANKMRATVNADTLLHFFSLCRGAASSAFESAVRADKNIWERKLEVPSRLVNLFDNLSRGSWSDRIMIRNTFYKICTQIKYISPSGFDVIFFSKAMAGNKIVARVNWILNYFSLIIYHSRMT